MRRERDCEVALRSGCLGVSRLFRGAFLRREELKGKKKKREILRFEEEGTYFCCRRPLLQRRHHRHLRRRRRVEPVSKGRDARTSCQSERRHPSSSLCLRRGMFGTVLLPAWYHTWVWLEVSSGHTRGERLVRFLSEGEGNGLVERE
jgi:hypothetical protein